MNDKRNKLKCNLMFFYIYPETWFKYPISLILKQLHSVIDKSLSLIYIKRSSLLMSWMVCRLQGQVRKTLQMKKIRNNIFILCTATWELKISKAVVKGYSCALLFFTGFSCEICKHNEKFTSDLNKKNATKYYKLETSTRLRVESFI